MNPEQFAKSNTEDAHQAAITAWCRMAGNCGFAAADDMDCYKVPGYALATYGSAEANADLDMFYAVPNGGKRDVRTAARLKQTGVKAGWPDMGIDVGRAGYFGLRIELKKPAALGKAEGKVSKKQKIIHDGLKAQGYYVIVCYGWEETVAVIKSYLTKERTLICH